MKHTFECKKCHKMKLVDTKEQLAEETAKHYIPGKYTRYGREHVPFGATMHIEMRTSKNSNKPYPVLVANDD